MLELRLAQFRAEKMRVSRHKIKMDAVSEAGKMQG